MLLRNKSLLLKRDCDPYGYEINMAAVSFKERVSVLRRNSQVTRIYFARHFILSKGSLLLGSLNDVLKMYVAILKKKNILY